MYNKFKLKESYNFIEDKNEYSMIKRVVSKKVYYCHIEEELHDRLILIENIGKFKIMDISFEEIEFIEEFVKFCWKYFDYPESEFGASKNYSNLDAFHDWFTDNSFFSENQILIFRNIKNLKSKYNSSEFTQMDFMKEILDISGYDVPWDDDRKLYIFVVGTK